jgi:hypothetical protein
MIGQGYVLTKFAQKKGSHRACLFIAIAKNRLYDVKINSVFVSMFGVIEFR